jgi:hypothetical protein
MNDSVKTDGDGGRDEGRRPGRRLPSIFDGIAPDQPLDMAAVEDRMSADLERRALEVMRREAERRRPPDAGEGRGRVKGGRGNQVRSEEGEMIEELYTGPASPAEALFFRRFAEAFDGLAGREMGRAFYEAFPEVLAHCRAGREADEAAAEWFGGYWQGGELLSTQK